MSVDLTADLTRLDTLLSVHAFAQRQLRPPAPPGAIAEVANRIGVTAPRTVEALYGWRDGAVPSQAGDWQLFMFPKYYQFLPLEQVEEDAAWPLALCADAGVAGFPFARDASSRWLVAQSGADDVVLRVSSDHVGPATPESSLLGLVRLACRALSGEDSELTMQFVDDKMAWVAPGEDDLL